MKYNTLLFRKLGKMPQNMLSAAVMIGAFLVNLLVSKKFHLKIVFVRCALTVLHIIYLHYRPVLVGKQTVWTHIRLTVPVMSDL